MLYYDKRPDIGGWKGENIVYYIHFLYVIPETLSKLDFRIITKDCIEIGAFIGLCKKSQIQCLPLSLLLFAHLTKQYIVVDSIAKTWPGSLVLMFHTFLTRCTGGRPLLASIWTTSFDWVWPDHKCDSGLIEIVHLPWHFPRNTSVILSVL